MLMKLRFFDQGAEECTSEEEEKCETVKKNCVDVEEEVCDENCSDEDKPQVCTQEEKTVCVEVEPECTSKPDEDCKPEYKQECTKVNGGRLHMFSACHHS